MSRKPTPPPEFDPWVIAELACPACHVGLRAEASQLTCTACGRAYPIIDGIPVLIIERAEAASESPARE